MRKTRTLDADYFEGLYRADDDPWRFASSAYETAKYAHTLEALADERAKRALEVGCSIGVLTLQLAAVCDALVATDVSLTALDQALRRCAAWPNVTFRLVQPTEAPPAGPFDLIVLSEVVYYWDRADLITAAQALENILVPGGRLLLVHWLGETDYPQSADQAVTTFREALTADYAIERQDRRPDYRLDLWRRA